MAAAQSVGLLHKKLGKQLGAFHEQAKKQEIKPVTGGGDLPADVNGIAKVNALRFAVIDKEGDNKGKMQFYASALVQEPATFIDKVGNKHFTRGMRTWFTIPLYDTPKRAKDKTVQDHWNKVLQVLGRLGIPVAQVSFENVEEVCNQVVKSGIFVRFRTWQGEPTKEYPNPQTNHVWEGAVEYDAPDVAAEMTQDDSPPPDDVVDDTITTAEGDEITTDDTEATDTSEPADVPVEDAPKSTRFGNMGKAKTTTPVKQPTAPAKNGQTKPAAAGKTAPKPAPKKAPEPEPEPSEPTLEEMAEGAEENEEYQAALTEAANTAGITDEEIAAIEGGWSAVVEEIRRRESGESEPEAIEEVTEEPATPKVGDVWLFTPPKGTKPVQGQIMKVMADQQKVNIKNLIDNKIYGPVSFDKLTPLPE